MCTAMCFTNGRHYFGRNLDMEYGYDESVVVVPRSRPLRFRCCAAVERHYAMIGTAFVAEGCPLFYDAVNERGLCMAALSFPDNAAYAPVVQGRDNVPPYEVIPWVLAQCADLAQARALLGQTSVAEIPFGPSLPLTPLHWMVSDKSGAIVLEAVAQGVRIHDNPAGVLTNSPSFPWHMQNLSNYMGLSADAPQNRFGSDLPLNRYSFGMGAIGLPGDFSSASRFVKAAFVRANAQCEAEEEACIAQMLRMLGSVSMPAGCVRLEGGSEITRYTSCCVADTGLYCYTTYENCAVTAVDMHRENLDGSSLAVYPMRTRGQIQFRN